MPSQLTSTDFPKVLRGTLKTLQVNLGYACNQACHHCHVDAGPWRREQMTPNVLALIPEVMKAWRLGTLDLTGGAPELHPQFRDLVATSRESGVEVIDRCNLTILLETGQEDLALFLAKHGVRVLASMPCYTPENVDRQRGKGVFTRSLEGLKRLNQCGYGLPGSGLTLDLVYNPLGASLPPPQSRLEQAYRAVLREEHGVVFNTLKVMCNMPIQRFADQLEQDGNLQTYQTLLRANHSTANLEHVMCRSMVSVDWQGNLYDCDFNQMLGIPSALGSHLADLLLPPEDSAAEVHVRVGDHCYGCTAGQGSSCGGALRESSS